MPQAPSFDTSTRLRSIRLAVLNRPVGGGLASIDMPKVGILRQLYLNISGAVAGTLTVPNAFGFSSIIQSCRLTVNSGQDIWNVSGPGYHWLVRDNLDLHVQDPNPETNGRTAVSATTYDVSMIIPVALNARDETGLFMLQNETTTVTLLLNWEADATVATGATVTGTCEVCMEFFEVPSNPASWPMFNIINQYIEDRTALTGAGDITYNIQRGNTLVQVLHLTQGTTWSRALLRAQQSSYVYDENPGSLEKKYNFFRGRQAALSGGAITGRAVRVIWDLAGTDGFGEYGSVRDLIDSSKLTDLASVITVAGAGNLVTVRHQLVAVVAG